MNDLLVLPDMDMPFAAAPHPDIDQIEQDAMEWAGVRIPPQELAQLAKTRAGRIVARTAAPEGSRDLLDAYARFLMWGFWFDDQFVDDVPADSAIHAPAIASVLDILDSRGGTGAAGQALENTFREILDDLQTVLSEQQMARWRQEMRLWFASMAFQNTLRLQTPTIAAYKSLRRYTVCTFPCIVLIDASRSSLIDWDDWNRPELLALRLHAANIVAWQNDIFSYVAERGHPGRFWNLPTVYTAHGHSLEEAIHRTAHDAMDETAAFLRNEAAHHARWSTAQCCHVASLKSWIRGCYDWHLEATGRYIGNVRG